MNYSNLTSGVIVAATAILVGYDLLPVASKPDGDTISEVLRAWGQAWPAVPFAWGALGGHFWSPLRRRWGLWHGLAYLCGLGLVIQALPLPGGPMVAMVVGIIAGATLWPVNE